mmetsp:Transcript_29467/g.70167  ORF Transcript_29467/g.70167 Transcript_29467/m.70167 type:complete len:266 (-) Transcript_29467:859-1656(-)
MLRAPSPLEKLAAPAHGLRGKTGRRRSSGSRAVCVGWSELEVAVIDSRKLVLGEDLAASKPSPVQRHLSLLRRLRRVELQVDKALAGLVHVVVEHSPVLAALLLHVLADLHVPIRLRLRRGVEHVLQHQALRWNGGARPQNALLVSKRIARLWRRRGCCTDGSRGHSSRRRPEGCRVCPGANRGRCRAREPLHQRCAGLCGHLEAAVSFLVELAHIRRGRSHVHSRCCWGDCDLDLEPRDFKVVELLHRPERIRRGLVLNDSGSG